jgi:hypothetical protein
MPIKPTDRIINTNAENVDFRKVPASLQQIGSKPIGIWYALGNAWLEWIETEMPRRKKPYNFKIEVNLNKMIVLNTIKAVEDFIKLYAVLPSRHNPMNNNFIKNWLIEINWPEVCKKYSGIELNPYFSQLHHDYMWYNVWDVPSGCIWKEDAIKRILKVNA